MPETTVVQLTPGRRPARRPKPRRTVPAGAPLGMLIDSWTLALEASNKATKTVRSYTDTARAFLRYLEAEDLPTDAEGVTATEVRRFLIHERERTSAASAGTHFRNLRVFWNWVLSEEERSTPSPVKKEDSPQVFRKVKKYLSADDLGALLDACKGTGFEARRDTAIVRCLIDNGVRVGGLADMLVEDLDLKGRRIRIRLKGGDELWLPIGSKTASAIDRYLRMRAGHSKAASPWLWLGVKGRGTEHFSHWGVRIMLARRGKQAEIAEKVHPHRFRGTAAHELLRAGAGEGDVQRILGWKSREMVELYTEELAEERARETHARLSPGDRI